MQIHFRISIHMCTVIQCLLHLRWHASIMLRVILLVLLLLLLLKLLPQLPHFRFRRSRMHSCGNITSRCQEVQTEYKMLLRPFYKISPHAATMLRGQIDCVNYFDTLTIYKIQILRIMQVHRLTQLCKQQNKQLKK